MTLTTFVVLRAIATEGETYGQLLKARTGLRSGSLYPMLARLEAAGWIAVRREDANPSTEGRPLRRYVSLTESGKARLSELDDRFGDVLG